jgi:hypothetical protein
MLEEVGPDRSGRVQRDERETLDDQRGTLPRVDQRPDEPPVIGACGSG